MKYLKLFEAFDSQIMSKTLGFIKNTNDKRNFMELLKNLCETIDLPFSKLSDEYFEYLPFKRALEKSDMTGDEPCKWTSRKEFPEYAVEGAKCESGKLKRMWGSRVREVECPHCNGTGIEPKVPELKLLKFWFDKEGKFITTTAVDGLVKKSRGFVKEQVGTNFSTNLNDYKVVKYNLSLRDIEDLEIGDFVFFQSPENGSGVAYVYRNNRDGRTYFLQDFAAGSDPGYETHHLWSRIAPFSWVIVSGREYIKVNKLKLKSEVKKEEEEESEIDPYTWNTKVNISRLRISPSEGSIYSLIKDANFAIVLDFGKLDKAVFKTKSQIEEEREESKKGALAFVKPEDIKTQNIKRYLEEIAKRSDITSDISNVNKVAKRFLGGHLVLFLINGDSSRFDRQFTNLITYYYSYIKSKNEGDSGEYYANQLSDNIKSSYENTAKKTSRVSNCLKEIKFRLKTEGKEPIYTDIIESLEDLSYLMYSQFAKLNIETIEDLEIFAAKIRSVREVCRTDRYKFYRLSRFFDYLEYASSDRVYDLFFSYIVDFEVEVLDSIIKMKRILIGLI